MAHHHRRPQAADHTGTHNIHQIYTAQHALHIARRGPHAARRAPHAARHTLTPMLCAQYTPYTPHAPHATSQVLQRGGGQVGLQWVGRVDVVGDHRSEGGGGALVIAERVVAPVLDQPALSDSLVQSARLVHRHQLVVGAVQDEQRQRNGAQPLEVRRVVDVEL